MHELSVTQSLIKDVLRACKEENAIPTVVEVDVGFLTTYKASPLTYYFEILKQEHKILNDCTLIVHEVPAKINCLDCQNEGELTNEVVMVCPICDSPEITVLSGKDFILKRIRT